MKLAAVREQLCSDPALGGVAFSDAWRTTVDNWLIEHFAEAVRSAGSGDSTDGVALVAVGGYGRGDLAPASDLDLVLVHRSKNAPAQLAEAIWYPIWDEGLKLGHAVRTIGQAMDLGAEDLDTATSLLAVRHLAGDESVSIELATAATGQWRKYAKRYLSMLKNAVEERQARAGEVAFLLEPDLKDGRGGLRDIHSLVGRSGPSGARRWRSRSARQR